MQVESILNGCIVEIAETFQLHLCLFSGKSIINDRSLVRPLDDNVTGLLFPKVTLSVIRKRCSLSFAKSIESLSAG